VDTLTTCFTLHAAEDARRKRSESAVKLRKSKRTYGSVSACEVCTHRCTGAESVAKRRHMCTATPLAAPVEETSTVRRRVVCRGGILTRRVQVPLTTVTEIAAAYRMPSVSVEIVRAVCGLSPRKRLTCEVCPGGGCHSGTPQAALQASSTSRR
jgi:hypothetical protein